MQDLSIGTVITAATNATTNVFYHYDAYTAGAGTVMAIIGISTNIFKNPRVAAAFAVLGAILTYVAIRLYEMGTFTAKIAELETVSSNLESTNQGLKETQEKNKAALKTLGEKVQQLQDLQSTLAPLIGELKRQEEEAQKSLERQRLETERLSNEVTELGKTKDALAQQKQLLEESISQLQTVNQQAIQHSALIGTLLSDVKKNIAEMNSSGVQLDENSQKWIADTQKQVEFLNVLTQQSISSMKQEGTDVLASMKDFVDTLTKNSSKITKDQLDLINSLRQDQDKIKQEIAGAILENEKIKTTWEHIKEETEREKLENHKLKETNKILIQRQQRLLEEINNAATLNAQSAKSISNMISSVEINQSNGQITKRTSKHARSSSFSGSLVHSLDTQEVSVLS